MAIVKPFKAIRPIRDKIALVASKSYDLYIKEELDAKLSFNPFTFLHIINAGYNQKNISDLQRFKQVQQKYLDFKKDGIFIEDEIPSFYIYQKITQSDSFCGIIATTSIEDYQNNIIKKHEGTLRKREILFEQYLKTTGFNAEAVLLTYPDDDTIQNIIKKYNQQRPEYEFSTTDTNVHLLWQVTNTEDINTVTNAFKKINNLYIADGHHRSASSFLLAENFAKENPNHTGKENYNFFMSFLLAESQVKLYEFNRFVKDLNGLSTDELLAKISIHYTIENKGKTIFNPTQKHQFSMYLKGVFYSLTLRKNSVTFTNSLSKLDAQLLYTSILKPILGIEDIRDESKITYSQNQLINTEFAVAFGMLPTNINELKKIVDDGLLMPPKTTYIEPKLKSGLTIYEFL